MAQSKLPRGIRLRGSKFFVDVTVDGKRKTATCATLEDAIKRRDQLKGALETGKDVQSLRSNAKAWTLREALDKTLALPPKDGWRGSSWERKGRVNVEDAMRFFGPAIPVDQITLTRIEDWLADCESRGNSDGTVNRKVSALRKVLKVAHKYGGLAELPQFPGHRKERVSRIRQISADEEQELLHRFTLNGMDWMAECATVLIDTGVRASELVNVWKQDFEKGSKGRPDVLLVHGTDGKGTKNGTVRSVPLTKRSAAIIRERMLNTQGRQVFPYTYDEMRHAWDQVRAQMGLSGDQSFTLHVARHTCCSRLVRGGVPLPTVQKWMGHKRIETTMRYAHLYPADLFSAVHALESKDAA